MQLKLYHEQISTWERYIIKKLKIKNKPSQRHRVDYHECFKSFSFSSNSYKVRLFLTEEGKLFHGILLLKCIELSRSENNVAGVRNSLDPFLKSYRILFLLK